MNQEKGYSFFKVLSNRRSSKRELVKRKKEKVFCTVTGKQFRESKSCCCIKYHRCAYKNGLHQYRVAITAYSRMVVLVRRYISSYTFADKLMLRESFVQEYPGHTTEYEYQQKKPAQNFSYVRLIKQFFATMLQI